MNRPQDGKAPSRCGSLHSMLAAALCPHSDSSQTCAKCFPPQWDGAGYHWHSHSAPGTKTSQGRAQQGPSCTGSSQAGLGHTDRKFALMLHLFWDKTGCQHRGQAAWHYYNHLENRNRIKSCPAPALGTEGCGAAASSTLQLLTLRGKSGHWDTGELQSPSGCYWGTNH